MAKAKPTTAEIYELIDPRDGSVRYIGKATDSQKRLKSHLRETRRVTPLYQWIAKLRGLGMAPTVRVRLTCGIDEWEAAERAAIAQGRADGWRLLNVADGGDEPFCPPEVRAENGRKVMALRTSTPQKAALWRAKKMLGTALKQGYVSEKTKVKMRLLAQKRPDLFGGWANI